MPPVRNLKPGYTIYYPNREKAASHVTKAIVALLLVASVVLMLIVTIGGWSKLQGLKEINIIWCALYLLIAFYVMRWKRGLLPMAAALGILLLILSLIAGLGVSGTSWFDRNHVGFSAPQALFGGRGLGTDVLGTVTLLIAPVQILLIAFSMLGFAQGWNVEQEIPEEELQRRRRGGGSSPSRAEPAPA